MRKNILVTSLGIKAVALSMGSVALSLGLNLVGLDSNQAQAALGLNALGNGSAGFNASLHAAYAAADNAGNAAAGTVLTTTTVIGWTGKSTVYASEIFGSGFASEKLPSADMAAVYYAIDGSINVTKFDAKFTLDNGAVFGDTPTACLDFDTGDCTALSILGGDKSTSGGGSGKNYVVFQIDTAGNPITATTSGHTTDAIVLKYNITSANALATAGSKIQMTATMRTPDPGYDVNPSSTITIAESKQGVKVELAPDTGIDADDDRITVASGGLEFAFTEATNEAKIGNLKVSNTCASDNCTVGGATASQTFAHTTDGYTAWKVGAAGDAAIDSAKSTFTITGGQFAASVTAPGKVELTDGNTPISTQATDAETAVFKLTGANFVSLTGFSTGADINIIADNKNPVNLVENAPIGQLTIAYSNTKFQTITYPSVELKKIKQDGTRCTIYNVPAPGSADIIAVRITNDSGVDGIVNATLYDGSGAEIFAAQPLNGGQAVAKGATLAVFNTDIAKLGTWTGRGVLVLTTTLPSIEVLGLLREAGNNAAPLTNLSTGATGDGCTN